jgi:hypothetical protein
MSRYMRSCESDVLHIQVQLDMEVIRPIWSGCTGQGGISTHTAAHLDAPLAPRQQGTPRRRPVVVGEGGVGQLHHQPRLWGDLVQGCSPQQGHGGWVGCSPARCCTVHLDAPSVRGGRVVLEATFDNLQGAVQMPHHGSTVMRCV